MNFSKTKGLKEKQTMVVVKESNPGSLAFLILIMAH